MFHELHVVNCGVLWKICTIPMVCSIRNSFFHTLYVCLVKQIVYLFICPTHPLHPHIHRRERHDIPLIVQTCVDEVEKRGLSEVGVYRVAGVLRDVEELRQAFDTGGNVYKKNTCTPLIIWHHSMGCHNFQF